MTITVDDRRLKRRLKRLGRAAARVMHRAKRDAAKQVRTQIKRTVSKQLALPVKDIASRLRVEFAGKAVRTHVQYRQVPAHHFKGWNYRGAAGRGQAFRETATGKRRTQRRTRATQLGLRVRFHREKPALQFPIAFRTRKVGGGKVFLQRTGTASYPLEPISGPPVHSKALEDLPDYTEHGRAALHRRLDYWVTREADKV